MLEEERAARAAAGKAPVAKTAPSSVRAYPGGMRATVLGADRLVTLKAERGPDGNLKVTHSHSDHVQSAASQLPTE